MEKVVNVAKNNLSPKFPPEPKEQRLSGKKAYYSDTNYQLLGAIIESVMEKPLHKLLEELIVEPLGLSSTFLFGHGQPRTPISESPATIYYKEKALHVDKAMKSVGADGGMVSNVEDSLKFLKYFMAGKLFEHPLTLGSPPLGCC